jgi:hypothetical protein
MHMEISMLACLQLVTDVQGSTQLWEALAGGKQSCACSNQPQGSCDALLAAHAIERALRALQAQWRLP